MIGPVLAFALLSQGLAMQQVFIASLVPGLLVILLLMFGLDHGAGSSLAPAESPPPLRWRTLDARLHGLLLATGGLALASVPEAFLVLWASERGLQLAWVPLIWAAASGVKAAIATPAGMLSDQLGRLPVLLIGWGVRIGVLVYLGLTHTSLFSVWTGFLAYAASLAFTEGAERALIGDIAPPRQRATVFGLFHMITGLAALPGALIFGALWQWWGETPAFLIAALLALLSMTLLWRYAAAARST